MGIRIDGLTDEMECIGPYASENSMLLEMLICEIHNEHLTLKEILKKLDVLEVLLK